MAIWYYVRRNVQNQARTSGVLEALDYSDAYDQARGNGHFTVVDLVNNTSARGILEEVKSRLFDSEQTLRVARINFWKVLRIHVRGGNPQQALVAYIPHCPSRRLRSALESILEAIENTGLTFLDGLEHYPTIFATEVIAQLRTATTTGNTISVLDRIIQDELMQRRVKSGSLMDRMDAYVTYGTTLVALWMLAKTTVPQTVQQAQQAHVEHNVAIIAIQVLGAIGNALQSPLFYLCAAIIILALHSTIVRLGQRERFLYLWEGVRWKLPFLRDADLNRDRAKALRTINDGRFSGVADDLSLIHAIGATKSFRFQAALRKHLRALDAGETRLHQAIAAEPLWGIEISSYFGAYEKGSIYKDVQDILRTLAEDEENSRRMSAYAGTGMHVILALAATAALTIIVTFAEFVVILAQARQL